ncbi:Rad52/22 family double-strand break repair protein-domain-containing protein [Amylostereum chailletii]|nr:Rad52/22 family double-strand break repair protein-domain-containing protein [Amylostereum chailletii]
MFSTPQTSSTGTPSAFLDESLFDVKPDISELELNKTASVQAKLNRRLGPEYVSQRPSPGGGPKLTYVEGWQIIRLANDVFGYNGWSSSIVKMETDFCDFSEDTRRYSVGVTAMIKITLRDGTFHEDVGYGTGDNLKSKGAALDKAKKEAVTDGVKRALRNFGNLLGLCLYEKQFTQEIVKIKAPPQKFDSSDLYRRADIENSISSTSVATAPSGTSNQDVKPISSIPPHVRASMPPPAQPPQVNFKGKAPQTPSLANPSTSSFKNGLNTPLQTPTFSNGQNKAPMNRPLPSSSASVPTPAQKPAPPRFAPPPQADRKVSFAPPPVPQRAPTPPPAPPKTEAELDTIDSFFNSDDDALFAAFEEENAEDPVPAPAPPQAGSSNCKTSTSSGQSSSGALTSSPSAGGFRFPAGSSITNRPDPPLPGQSAHRYTAPSGASSSVVGVKRPAEGSMQTRRPFHGQGMGLAQPPVNTGRREPLGNLDIGVGTDAKRVRR